jgi:hypothetical protein
MPTFYFRFWGISADKLEPFAQSTGRDGARAVISAEVKSTEIRAFFCVIQITHGQGEMR